MKNTNDMTGSINIIDDEYSLWVKQLGSRYRQSRISAACQVNGTLIEYYWNLGRDITSKDAENRYGSRFYSRLSADLRSELPGVEGLSETNIRYAKRFYQLYCGLTANIPQVVEDLRKIPWGHHRYIIDKCSGSPDKAMFYVMQAWHNGWSRAMLLNFIDSRLYERQGKALTNFKHNLPDETSGLAQELTKDPYSFDFLAMRDGYNER